MRTNEHDDSSSTSSSSHSQSEATKPIILPSTNHSKRKCGRKKFKETRHPVYRGVRLRNGSKWVCEVREPGTKNRIWLGTFPTAEMAGRAYDAATLTLSGDDSPLNFNDSARLIKRANSCSVSDVKRAAFEAALAFGSRCHESTIALSGDDSPLTFNDSARFIKRADSYSAVSDVKRAASEVAFAFGGRCYESTSSSPPVSPPGCFEVEKDGKNAVVEAVETGFVDEEMVFNMPGFYNSMAEGLVITPPGMKRGFDWSSEDVDFSTIMDLTLWKY